MTHQEQLEIGAYLLGALAPRERSAFEAHLAQCAACRNEVADLAGIPALLGKVSLSDVMAAPADPGAGLSGPELRPDSDDLVGPVPGVVRLPDTDDADDLVGPVPGVVRLPEVDAADQHMLWGTDRPPDPGAGPPPPSSPAIPPPPLPRAAPKPITAGPFGWRHRTVLLAAAAVLAILAVVGSLALVSGRRSPDVAAPATPAPAPVAPGQIRTVSLLPTVAGAHGSVQIAGTGLGSLLRLSMGGVRPGQDCSLLVAGDDGNRQSVASWTANYEGEANKLGNSALQPADIRWVGVATPDGTVLLQARLAA